MHQFRDRLNFLDRCIYDQAIQNFKKITVNHISEEEISFLKSILEIDDLSEVANVQNSINLARSWCEINKKEMPQSIMNRIFEVCFKFPQLISQLSLFKAFSSNNSWLFNSIFKFAQKHTHKFQESIKNNFPIWNFIIDEFSKDILIKSKFLDLPMYERPISFLLESLIFSWPIEKKSHVTIQDIIQELIRFLAQINNEASSSLLSLICLCYFEISASLLIEGHDRLSSKCIALLSKHNIVLKGDPLDLAIKLYPFDPFTARKILDKNNSKDFKKFMDSQLLPNKLLEIKPN